MSDRPELDVVIVGAGFAGLYMLHRARGIGLSARAIEAGGGVGGTWYWNRYPGARCDVESMEYSYQFSEELQQEWVWTERYASQPEILDYANHVADRFDLRRDIQFETRVVSAIYDEAADRWRVRTDDEGELSAQYLVMATGCLSSARIPEFPGLDRFRGATYHTGRWPHEDVDFSGQQVGVIGTGSSGIQSIPIIARQASRLTVFQRTASYSIPARNGPLDEDEQRAVKDDYPAFRARNSLMQTAIGTRLPISESSALAAAPDERARVYEARWEHGGLPFSDWIDATELCAESSGVAGHIAKRVRDLVVDEPFALAFVGESDACPPPERHLPIAVEGATGIDADGERRNLGVLAPPTREEVADRTFHRGLRVVVPIHSQDLVAPTAGRCEPDVLDRTRALDVGEDEGRVRSDRDGRRDLPSLAKLAARSRAGAFGGHSAPAFFAGEVLGADRPGLGLGKPPDVSESDSQSVPYVVVSHDRWSSRIPSARVEVHCYNKSMATPLGTPGSAKSLPLILARELASNLATPMFLLDAGGMLVFYNDAAALLLGKPFAELGEIPSGEFGASLNLTTPDGEPLRRRDSPSGIAFYNHRPAHMTVMATAYNGVRREYEATAYPLLGATGEMHGVVAVFWETKPGERANP